MRKYFIGIVLFIILFVLTTPVAAETKVLKFGVFPYISPRQAVKLFYPIAKRIEKETGYLVKVLTAPDYHSFMSRAENEEYDILIPATASYLELMQKGVSYDVIAMGNPTFHGGVIVRKDSDVHTIDQLKGSQVAAVGPFSYAAYRYFVDKIKKQGYTIPEDFRFIFLGKLDTVVFAVLNKRFKAGVIRTDALNWERFSKISDEFRVIDRSVDIPQFPFAVKRNLSKDLKQHIQKVFLNIKMISPEDKAILKALRIKSIISAKDSDYDTFRKIYYDSSR